MVCMLEDKGNFTHNYLSMARLRKPLRRVRMELLSQALSKKKILVLRYLLHKKPNHEYPTTWNLLWFRLIRVRKIRLRMCLLFSPDTALNIHAV